MRGAIREIRAFPSARLRQALASHRQANRAQFSTDGALNCQRLLG